MWREEAKKSASGKLSSGQKEKKSGKISPAPARVTWSDKMAADGGGGGALVPGSCVWVQGGGEGEGLCLQESPCSSTVKGFFVHYLNRIGGPSYNTCRIL
jgi:hypothetical protein